MDSVWEVDRARAAWWAFGVALALSVALVVHTFIGTFVFGVFIYYATRPVYRRLSRRVRPASLAAVLALFLLALPALLLLAYTLAIGIQEVNALLERGVNLGPLEPYLTRYLDIARIVQNPQDLLREESLRQALMASIGDALNYLGFLGNAALHLFIMIGIAFYLLRDDHRLAGWANRRFADGDGVLVAYARAVDRDFSNIFFGNILNALLTALIGAVSYNALAYVRPAGVPMKYPTLVGLLAGVASLIPVVGMKLVYFPYAGYLVVAAAAVGSEVLWFPAAFFVVSFVLVDSIPDFVLRPYVSGRGLHLGMVMFAYIFGPLLFGWYGIFLGPMLLVLVVHFGRLVLPELLAGERIVPEPRGDEVGHAEAAPTDGETEAGDAEAADGDEE